MSIQHELASDNPEDPESSKTILDFNSAQTTQITFSAELTALDISMLSLVTTYRSIAIGTDHNNELFDEMNDRAASILRRVSHLIEQSSVSERNRNPLSKRLYYLGIPE